MVKTLPNRTVVIVGGGLTAGLLARQLTAASVQVTVLERGIDRRNSAADRVPTQRDELRWGVRAELAQDWGVQTFTLRHNANEDAQPLRRNEAFLPGEGLGGAASHWNGNIYRWQEYDPVLRTHYTERYGARAIPPDIAIADWGVGYAELEPYHDLFEKLFGLAGKAGNIAGKLQAGGNPYEAPRRDDYPQPPLEMTEAGVIFAEGATKLGYHPYPGPAANSPAAYVNPDGIRLGACQYCGHCERFMCEAQAKATPEALLYPLLATRPSFELRLQSHVVGIEYDKHAKRARGVRYIDLQSGEEFIQPADVVVLGAFMTGNTQLLLNSKIGTPYDVKSGRGVVGKSFAYQANTTMAVFFKERWLNPFLSAGGTLTVIDDLNNDNADHAGLDFLGGGAICSVARGRPIANRNLPPGAPKWGSKWKQASADWYAHSFTMLAQGTGMPHRENYLDLDPTYTDAYGQPLLRMTFDWRANDIKMSTWLTEKMAELARAMGPSAMGPANPKKSPFDTRYYQQTHMSGGTVMGTSPSTSVVSPRLQHWDAQNLFVVGASVLPQHSGCNTSGPIAALALRLGDDLVRYVKSPGAL